MQSFLTRTSLPGQEIPHCHHKWAQEQNWDEHVEEEEEHLQNEEQHEVANKEAEQTGEELEKTSIKFALRFSFFDIFNKASWQQ